MVTFKDTRAANQNPTLFIWDLRRRTSSADRNKKSQPPPPPGVQQNVSQVSASLHAGFPHAWPCPALGPILRNRKTSPYSSAEAWMGSTRWRDEVPWARLRAGFSSLGAISKFLFPNSHGPPSLNLSLCLPGPLRRMMQSSERLCPCGALLCGQADSKVLPCTPISILGRWPRSRETKLLRALGRRRQLRASQGEPGWSI